MRSTPLARVISSVPVDRVDLGLGDGSVPQVGDIAEIDQVYTAPSGEQMHMATCTDADGRVRWVADLLLSEITPA
jgi:hypothetical protein